jgi:hypothetical protein
MVVYAGECFRTFQIGYLYVYWGCKMFCRGFYICPSVQSFLHAVCFRHNNDGSGDVVPMTVAVCHGIAEKVHHILSCDIHVSTATLLRIWVVWSVTFLSLGVSRHSEVSWCLLRQSLRSFEGAVFFWDTKKIIKLIVVYGNETWTPSERVFTILATWEGEILRKIDGPICVRGMWRIRTNEKLYILISKHRHCNRR